MLFLSKGVRKIWKQLLTKIVVEKGLRGNRDRSFFPAYVRNLRLLLAIAWVFGDDFDSDMNSTLCPGKRHPRLCWGE